MTLDEALARHPGAEAFRFGDHAELCAAVITMIRAGRTTATCSALDSYASGVKPMPTVGCRSVALRWSGEPALVIETEEVSIRRFLDVDDDFARSEGYGDGLTGWRIEHEGYFRRAGLFSPEMKLVCERFRVVEDFG